jgi:hypothetical protein
MKEKWKGNSKSDSSHSYLDFRRLQIWFCILYWTCTVVSRYCIKGLTYLKKLQNITFYIPAMPSVVTERCSSLGSLNKMWIFLVKTCMVVRTSTSTTLQLQNAFKLFLSHFPYFTGITYRLIYVLCPCGCVPWNYWMNGGKFYEAHWGCSRRTCLYEERKRSYASHHWQLYKKPCHLFYKHEDHRS